MHLTLQFRRAHSPEPGGFLKGLTGSALVQMNKRRQYIVIVVIVVIIDIVVIVIIVVIDIVVIIILIIIIFLNVIYKTLDGQVCRPRLPPAPFDRSTTPNGE